ncbi:MAG: MaoC family dehydratase N-terminal domain-containing protein [Rhodomicrobium sp.]
MGFEHLKAWIGRSEIQTDVAAQAPLDGLAATLDHADPPWRPGEVPPLGHWLYFLPRAPQHEIGPDGHPKRGGFLPPVELPRRMWGGGEFEFLAPVPIGAAIERRSTIANVEHKAGRSGAMVFVRVEHEISVRGAAAIREVHNIVYREGPKAGAGAPAPEKIERAAEFSREIVPDPVLLFRYSALTFNGHRIHYDRSYCEYAEGYPGLVVHGPLTATLLMDLYLRQRPGAAVSAFRFRARRPLFDIDPFSVCGMHRPGGADLWALDREGFVAMTAGLEAA